MRLLECLITRHGRYAEIGCGGGSVCRLISETAFVYGFDISPLALENARRLCGERNTSFVQAAAEHIPMADGVVDGCCAFEVLEHVWDPLPVVVEMIRITRRGGFVLISAPNAFSLDMHIPKRASVRACEMILAGIRLATDCARGRTCVHVRPHLEGAVYPDCDMITSIVPSHFARAVGRMGCKVIFWDTTYMCAQKDNSGTDLYFQRNTGRPFFRHFGNHLLLMAVKK